MHIYAQKTVVTTEVRQKICKQKTLNSIRVTIISRKCDGSAAANEITRSI